jgi:hypothetical protein
VTLVGFDCRGDEVTEGRGRPTDRVHGVVEQVAHSQVRRVKN